MAIEIRNISKSFNGKDVLKDVNMTLYPGRVYGFLGNNGAGKTTLMRTIFNMVIPDSGAITYNGIPQKDIDYSHWFYFTEKDVVPANLTVKRYLKDCALLAKLSVREYRKRMKVIYKYVNTNFKLNKKINKLSSGQQKVVGCLALLILKPEVVFLDEPTANMDVRNQEFVMNIIKELKNDGRIVVITTHLLKEIDNALTDAVVLDKGEITYSAELKKSDVVEKIFEKYTTPESNKYKGMSKKEVKKAKKLEAKNAKKEAKRQKRTLKKGTSSEATMSEPAGWPGSNIEVSEKQIKDTVGREVAIDEARLERYLNEK